MHTALGQAVVHRAEPLCMSHRVTAAAAAAGIQALCDKWTGVVEYPAGSGIKCLAIKSWMREGAAAAAAAGHGGGSRGVGEPEGDDDYNEQY